jgi:hypothetical protein
MPCPSRSSFGDDGQPAPAQNCTQLYLVQKYERHSFTETVKYRALLNCEKSLNKYFKLSNVIGTGLINTVKECTLFYPVIRENGREV